MATKKKLKYEENKKIALVFNVNEYNDIGIDNDEVAAKGTGVYKTRKLDAHIKDTTQPLRIDQARPVTKKKIAVPETKNDDNYYPFIDFKRAHVETVNQTRGYKRAFLDDHLPNPEATALSSAAIALEAGVMLAAAYMLTRRVWLAIGIHMAWNFTQSGIFGAPTSGVPSPGFLEGQLHGPALLSGGTFGPEASIVAVTVCLALGLYMLRLAHAKGHILQPSWRRVEATV